MKNQTKIVLVSIILLSSFIASGFGIFTESGNGKYYYKSIRGELVKIYGKGIYKDMSSEVAPQGIAQDYVTFFVATPLLLISYLKHKKYFWGKLFFTGVIGYFLVTYLFYIAMGMYNYLFLLYALILGSSFFLFFNELFYFVGTKQIKDEKWVIKSKYPGYFLIFNAITIGLLWLSIIVPPLLSGEIYPKELHHYTTLIVQAFDLAILLPLAFLSGYAFIKEQFLGYISLPIYLVFLSILMTALTAKIFAMGISGYNIFPVVFIIPVINLLIIYTTYSIFRIIRRNKIELLD